MPIMAIGMRSPLLSGIAVAMAMHYAAQTTSAINFEQQGWLVEMVAPAPLRNTKLVGVCKC